MNFRKQLLLLALWGCSSNIVLGAESSLFSTTTYSPAFVATSSAPAASSPTASVIFGTTVEDPYRWLEDGQSEKVKAWVDAEDQKARQYLSVWPYRQQLLNRLSDLMKEDKVSVPQEANGRIFFTRRNADQDKPTVYWHVVGGADVDHVLLKPDPKGEEALGDWWVSPDGNKFAYLLKKNNSDEAVLHVRRVDNWDENSNDMIPGANFADLSWAEDSQGFYYVGLPTDSKIPPGDRVGLAKVRFHSLGKASESDPEIFPETKNSSLYLSPKLSRDGMWLLVSVMNGWTSTNVFFRDVHNSSSTFKPLFVSTSATADVLEWGGAFYIMTNDSAPNYQILKTYVRQTDPSLWTVLVPERKNTIIESMNLVGGYLVLTIMKNAKMGLEVRRLDGTLVRTALQPTPGEIHHVSAQEYSNAAYFDFDSAVAPRQVYKVDIPSGTVTTWWAPQHKIDASKYLGVQVKFRSKDGTPISMTLVQKKGMPMDGSVPFLMEGYGGFGSPALLRYSPMLIPWLEAGGGYALPNLRGGGEYGEAWHQAGMLKQKQHTFDDFIAAAQYLIDKKYTKKDRLVIQGVSNGGLLVAAAETQRPDLFKALVCKSPLTDMIRYPLFGEGAAWIPEYGSPKIEDEFRALYAYSPYHHVRRGVFYPATLLITAENDDRVDPMHARKFAAALQEANASSNPILLETERNAGHEGSASKQAQIEDVLDRLSFLMNAVDMKP